jgi:hypothetical protein
VRSRYVVTVHQVGTGMGMSRALVELSQPQLAPLGKRWGEVAHVSPIKNALRRR